MDTEHSTPVSEQVGALQSLADTVEFLAKHPPYAQLNVAERQQLVSNAKVSYYPEGAKLECSATTPPGHIAIVLQGLVRGQTAGSAPSQALAEDETDFVVGVGETLFNVAVYEGRPSRSRYQTLRDCFLLEIPAEDFIASGQRNTALQRYCQRRGSELIDLARKRRAERAGLELQTAASLDRGLAELAAHPAVTCNADTSLSDAVALMHRHRIGSIVVTDVAEKPTGIFTLHDLRAVVAEGRIKLDMPISAVMTTALKTLNVDAPVFEAVALMSDLHIRHLPIEQDGKIWGVVSEKDLFALQRGSLVQVARKIGSAATVVELRNGLIDARELSQNLLAHGASARQLTAIITRLNDTAVKRCIEIVAQSQRLPGNVIWLAFGSEGRGEQTLATDQDNGLVLLDDEADRQRGAVLQTCAVINQALDEIGFPLCRGNTMASNPDLCLNLADWRERLLHIVASPTPQNLVDATIFFDARVVLGDASVWTQMMEDIQLKLASNQNFLRALAVHALEWKPSLNLLGKLRSKKIDGKPSVDLKKQALQPIIAAVRVLALANQITAVNTEDRLRLLAEAGAIREPDSRAWIEAFAFVQLQRMTLNQRQLERDLPLGNVLELAALNPLDKRILREAMRQIGRLQQHVKLRFQTT